MFKIESYITSIILANADRYIKNFRKQDAQLSLWGGDATFHNIELNIEALNEEVQLPFKFTSGYIHELVIHVPWTKLTSEHVTVFINTIECVVKLRSFDEVKDNANFEKRNCSQSASKEPQDKMDDVLPPSYISSLMNKIMNNLSINCKNFILKFVEEDIVLSMNIEKLELDNVNGFWKKAFTDMNSDVSLVRKVIDLSGVTICLDKQNSSGRIETYLEPLLYRCPVVIRIYKKYMSPLLKKPVSTSIDIYSLKMLFTISEPQVSMLLKLYDSITVGRTKQKDCTETGDVGDSVSHSSVGCIDFSSSKASEIDEEQSSWGYWLWSMMPTILSQESDEGNALKPNQPNFSIFNVGLYTQNLEIALKFSSVKMKKTLRSDYKCMIKGRFTGCLFRVTYKNTEWMNLQAGVSSVVIEPVYEFKIDPDGPSSSADRYIISGNPDIQNYLRGTLFDEHFFKYRRKCSLETYSEDSEKSNVLENATTADYNVTDSDNCSLDKHLFLYTESSLLERTPALAVDYVKYSVIDELPKTAESTNETESDDSNNMKHLDNFENIQKRVLLRFVFGPTEINLNAGLLRRFQIIHKIMKTSNNFDNSACELQPNNKCVESTQIDHKSLTYPYRITQYTFFDLAINLHPHFVSPTVDDRELGREAGLSGDQSTHLLVTSKCIDAKTTYVYLNNSGHTTSFYQYDFQVKIVGVDGSLVTRGVDKTLQFKVGKFEYDHSFYNLLFFSILRHIRVNTSKVELISSKPSLLLAYYINKSLWELWHEPLNFHAISYIQEYFAPLTDDIYTEYGQISLNLSITGINVNYKCGNRVQSTNVTIDDCFSNICKQDARGKCVAILLYTEKKLNNMPCLEVSVQNIYDNTANNEISPHPKCVFFELVGLCFNVDPLLFKWIQYSPRVRRNVQKIPSLKSVVFEKESSTFRSTSNVNRKVSESSSSSYSKRIGTVLSFYPKPKESVHSSLEQEVISPQTDDILLDPLDTYASSCLLPSLPTVTEKQFNLAERLSASYDSWKDLIVYGELSRIKIYLPTHSLTEFSQDEVESIELTIKKLIETNNTEKDVYGVLFLTFEALKIKSDISVPIFSNALKTIPISFPNSVWFPGKLSFPWTIEITNFGCFTEFKDSSKPLLRSFSFNCTVSTSTKEQENKPSNLAVYVHFDVQPVVISVNSDQVLIVIDLVTKFGLIYGHFLSRKEKNEKLAKIRAVEVSNVGDDCLKSNNIHYQVKKVTGWIQFTLTKFSFSIYDHSKENRTKLVTELEDTIISLEFDDVYHKVKLKIGTLGMDHYVRDESQKCWVKGSFSGVIIKRRVSELQTGSVRVEDSNDRFLLATVTRALYSNLQTRLSPAMQPSTSSSTVANDKFITEIILNLCSIDVILPTDILLAHVSVILPLLLYNFNSDTTPNLVTQLDSKNLAASSTLPLIYIDTHNLRLFLPSTTIAGDAETVYYDTVVFEIGSIYADCDLENPIIRTYIQPGFRKPSFPLPVPSEINDRQYQVQFADIFLSTGSWTELENWIKKENSSILYAVPGILQENPAVMWNQGCHPEDGKTNLQNISPILSKFSCNILIAPPLLLRTDHITINATYEVNIPFSLEVTLSFPQLILLSNMIQEFNQQFYYVLEKLRTIYLGKEQSVLVARKNKFSECTPALEDSGIESIEQSSIASSVHKNSKTQLNEKYRLSVKPITVVCEDESTNLKRQASTNMDVFVSIADVNVILYTVKNKSNDNENRLFRPLFLCHFSQPHLLFCMKNDLQFIQVSCLHVKLKLSNRNADYIDNIIPATENFPIIFVETKTRNKSDFTGVSYPGVSLEVTINNISVPYKINIQIGQPLYVLLNVELLNSVDDIIHTCLTEYRECINTKSYLSERQTEIYGKSLIQADVKQSPGEGFGLNCCNDNIFNTNVSTSQLIFILRSNNEDGIGMLLCVTDVRGNCSYSCNVITGGNKVDLNVTLEGVTLATFQSPLTNLYDMISERLVSTINLNSVLLIQPTDLKFQFATGCTACDCAGKYIKFFISDIIINMTPFYVHCIESILREFGRWMKTTKLMTSFNSCTMSADSYCYAQNQSMQLYKDDLRAGAFQCKKISEDMSRLPSAYELIFCDCLGYPYMIWKYPQPRTISKLHVYPVIAENLVNSVAVADVYCELQYYNEISFMFERYVDFKLSDERLQKIVLPSNQIDAKISTCWRIVIQCPVFKDEKKVANLRNSFDISSLIGCVEIDSLYQADLLPTYHMVINVSTLQVNFTVYQHVNKETTLYEHYIINNSWIQHNLFSLTCEEYKMNILNRSTDYLLKCSSKIKTYVLNYQYLMYQILTEPFSIDVIFHRPKETQPVLSLVLGNVVIRVSQNVSHTLSVFHWLWTTYSKSDHLLTQVKVTAPYIICNNTNCTIVISQDSTAEQIHLAPGTCHLYSWYTPFLQDVMRFTVLYRLWKLQSTFVNIRNTGTLTVNCVSVNEAIICSLLITVTKISPIVRKIVLEGHLRIFNQTDTKIDAIAVATDPSASSDTFVADSLQTIYSASYAEKKTLSSMIVPLNYNLTMKIRDALTSSTNGSSNWSGIIPIKLIRRNNNKSWLVKVPLKESKDHFQGIWCDVIEETIDQNPRLLVLFKPLCLLQSYLPWKTHLKVLNEKGIVVNNILVGDNGSAQDLFIPDTVTLDNFCIQWQQREDVQNNVSLTLVKPFSKPDFNYSLPCIDNLLTHIELSKCSEKWSFIRDNTSNMKWMTDSECSITPNIKINQKQIFGMGLYIEIYPQIIITNTLGCAVSLNINICTFTIEHNHIFIPPTIEGAFKLAVQNESCYYFSEPLSLFEADNASKVSADIPLTGFISTMINCTEHITFVNIKSKNLDNMRIIDICSPYLISNNSSSHSVVNCSAFVICRTNAVSNTPIEIPNDLTDSYIVNGSNVGIPIIKWKKIGDGDTQILPYLLFKLGDYISCPVRVCDLSEKYSLPLLFSKTTSVHCEIAHPSLSVVVHHQHGQIFISIYDEPTPDITIHNETSLTLNVASSKNEQGNQVILDSNDWKWKFYSLPKTVSHYRIHNNFKMQEKSKKIQPYLVFSLRNDYITKDVKWSKGIRLHPCRKELIILALSQQHITVSVFQNGFTYVVLIEPATMTDLPCTNVRKQLLRTHLVSGKDTKKLKDEEQTDDKQKREDVCIPVVLKNYYNTDIPDITFTIRICIRSLAIILVSDNTITDDQDAAIFTLDNVIICNTEGGCKKNEVKSESTFAIYIGRYQLDNEEYRYRVYDFPVILINKPNKEHELDYCLFKQPSEYNINRLIEESSRSSEMAVKITLNIVLSQFRQFDIRDVDMSFAHQHGYIEDKYVVRLKSLSQSILSSAINNDISLSYDKDRNIVYSNNDVANRDSVDVSLESAQQRNQQSSKHRNSFLTDKCDSIKRRSTTSKTFLPGSTSSKSVNVSEYGDPVTVDNNNDLSANQPSLTSEKYDSDSSTHFVDSCIINRNVIIRSKSKCCDNNDIDYTYRVRIPDEVVKLSTAISHPIKLRLFRVSSINCTVSIHTSTTFYIALDHSPLHFSEFSREYLIVSAYEFGQLLTVHYMMGAIYGSGWALSSLEFVGSPGGLARTVSTGIKDFVSLPIYGIADGPQGFVLGIAHGSASLLKHLMAGTLTSVTKFAGSWARTLDRFTLDTDDLLQSEVVRRKPPSNITEGIVQGLTEFGISLLGGISGIAHHPLQYAVSETTDRSLFGSVSLGLIGMITRPLSGAAELVARTGQGILSHVGWNTLPKTKQSLSDHNNTPLLFNTTQRYRWKNIGIPNTEYILFVTDGAIAVEKIKFVTLVLTNEYLYINESETDELIDKIKLRDHYMHLPTEDGTLITISRMVDHFRNPEEYNQFRIKKFIQDTNKCLGIERPYEYSEQGEIKCSVRKLYVNPDVRSYMKTLIKFIKKHTSS